MPAPSRTQSRSTTAPFDTGHGTVSVRVATVPSSESDEPRTTSTTGEASTKAELPDSRTRSRYTTTHPDADSASAHKPQHNIVDRQATGCATSAMLLRSECGVWSTSSQCGEAHGELGVGFPHLSRTAGPPWSATGTVTGSTPTPLPPGVRCPPQTMPIPGPFPRTRTCPWIEPPACDRRQGAPTAQPTAGRENARAQQPAAKACQQQPRAAVRHARLQASARWVVPSCARCY